MAERKRHGLYIREVGELREELTSVSAKTGIPVDALVGILLRPYAGRVAEVVSKHVVGQLGLFSETAS